MTGKPIFFDPTGKRGRALTRLAWTIGTLSAFVMTAFVATLLIVHRPERSTPPSLSLTAQCQWIYFSRTTLGPYGNVAPFGLNSRSEQIYYITLL